MNGSLNVSIPDMPRFVWKKLGLVFNPTEHAGPHWMHHFAQTPSVIIFDDFVRIYFCTRPPSDANGQFVSRIGFIDVDRGDLFQIRRISQEPVLQLGELGTFDEFGTNPVSVIRNGNQIRAYYAGWTRCESVPFNGAIGLAVSDDDGVSFQRLGPGPVLSYTPDEPFVIGSPKIRRFGDLWYLHYCAGRGWFQTDSRPESVYKIRCAISEDGIRWTKLGRDLIEDRLGPHECQAGADILFHDGLYHMFFSYRQPPVAGEEARGYRIGYAVSRDLMQWQRHESSAGIDLSPDGWDSAMVSYAHVFELDGRMIALYQGNEVGRCGFGMAVMESYKKGGKQ